MSMYNFNFCNPTRILFGTDYEQQASNLIPENARVLIVYGGGSAERNGALASARRILGSRFFLEAGGIEPNPELSTCIRITNLVKEKDIDFIIAVGGGSVIDATKFIASAAKYDGNPAELLGLGEEAVGKAQGAEGTEDAVEEAAVVEEAVPFATILTLPATGSEMNPYAVISDTPTQTKLTYYSPLSYPKFSILDPRFTYSIPKPQLINGIVDPFIHVCEEYLNTPVNARVQDRWAESLISTLIEVAPVILNDQDQPNYAERANWMWAATNALNGFISQGTPEDWGTHLLGHEITAIKHTDHAMTLSMIYPAYLTVMFDQKKEKLAQLGRRVFSQVQEQLQANPNLSTDELARATIKAINDFFKSIGAATSFADLGYDAELVPQVLANMKRNGFTAIGEDGAVTIQHQEEILNLAVKGVE